MKDFERTILKKFTPCHDQDKDKLAEALAIVHVELIMIHPFREGNGRLARLFANLMVLQSGFPPLDYATMSRNKPAYIKAIHAGLKPDYIPMKKIFLKIIDKSLRNASA